MLTDNSLKYIKDTSKTNQGGLAHRKVTGKVVHAFRYEENTELCPVLLFKKYCSLCPSEAVAEHKPFYLTPRQKVNAVVWFTTVPVGVNTLGGAVKRVCLKADVKGNYTNHSLRATAATRLYHQGVDEQQIQEVTGHRSLEALRLYKRTHDGQRLTVSRMLEASQPQCSVFGQVEQSGESSRDPDMPTLSQHEPYLGTDDCQKYNSGPSVVYNNCTFNISK